MFKNKDSDYLNMNLMLGSFMLPVVLFLAWITYYNNVNPLVCVESSKVMSILSLQYRSATVLLENGKTQEVSQVMLKPGDDFCHRMERKNKF